MEKNRTNDPHSSELGIRAWGERSTSVVFRLPHFQTALKMLFATISVVATLQFIGDESRARTSRCMAERKNAGRGIIDVILSASCRRRRCKALSDLGLPSSSLPWRGRDEDGLSEHAGTTPSVPACHRACSSHLRSPRDRARRCCRVSKYSLFEFTVTRRPQARLQLAG